MFANFNFDRLINKYGVTSLEELLVALLIQEKLSLAGAESCTGGLISSKITAVSGVSSVFEGALISYSNKVKNKLLGVDSSTLDRFGAVSIDVVKEMLMGVHSRFGVDSGFAVSGIAGPGGGTPEKPVGTVIIGVFLKEQQWIESCFFTGTRDEIREKSSLVVLKALIFLIYNEISIDNTSISI